MKFLIVVLLMSLSMNIFANSYDDKEDRVNFYIPKMDGLTPIPGVNFKTNIQYEDDIQPELVDKLKRAAKLMRDIVSSQEFKDAVTGHKYCRSVWFRYICSIDFKRNEGDSTEEVYAKIMAGAELFKPENNQTYDATYRVYDFGNDGVRASTNINDHLIKYNEYHLIRDSLSEVAATMLHEWLHKHGYLHSRYSNKTRKYTVPYGAGTNIVREIGGAMEWSYRQ